MKTSELAQKRIEVKKEIRRHLHETTGSYLTSHILNTAEDLYEDEHLIESIERVRFQFSRMAETFSYNENLSIRWVQYRDYIKELINWLIEERQDLIEKWNNQADILTGRA